MLNANEITDGITTGIEVRKQRGLEIAALARIDKEGDVYVVPSVTSPRPTKYKVTMGGLFPKCTCPDFETRGCKCKHIYAVEYTLQRERSVTVEPNGDTTITDKVTITQTRKTYAQNWPAYNEAQTNEKRQFQILLADLCKGIKDEDEDEKPSRGRPRFPLRDAVFSIVFKVYSTYSGRRFTSDLCDAQAKGYIDRVPHYNTAFKYIENPNLYPILLSMIERASLPLKAVEENFAVDSTGFCFSRFTRWFDVKYNKFTSKQEWVKAHICTGVKTNVVTAIEIHGKDSGDAPQLPSLVQTTAKNFTMKEVSADKGYTGGETHDAIANVGAVPFIAFKANATGGIGGLFAKMFHYFNYRRDEFLGHYHRRSNVESTVMMIKTKFGDGLRSKSDVAGRNEVLCKTLCHNICCLISAMYELGIQPEFGLADAHKMPTMPTNAVGFAN
jgi:transposase